MKRKFLSLWALCLMVIASCSSTSTSTTWNSEQKPTRKLEKLLLVGLTNNVENRALVENELSYTLAIEGGYQAYSSLKHLPPKKAPPVKEDLIPLIDSAGIDGVLTFELMDIKEGSSFESSSRIYSYSPEHPDFYEYLRSYRNQYVTGYTVGTNILVIKSNLYEVLKDEQEGKLIFSAISETINPTDEQLEVAVADFVKSLYRALKKSGYLQKVK